MFSVTVKGLWAHKLRYVLTGLAVVLGVAFMSGTMILTDTMKAGFDTAFESQNEGADVLVQRGDGIEGEFASTRQRVDASAVDDVAEVDGVAAAAGSIQGFTTLVHADGTVASESGMGVTIGANWIADVELNPFTLSSGRIPSADDEAVLDNGTFEREGWRFGDTFQVLSSVGPHSLTLVGTASFGAIDGLPGSTLIATNDDTAQALFAEPGRYDNVVVAADKDVSSMELASGIDDALAGTGLEAITGEENTQNKKDTLAEDLAFIDTFLMAFVYVALFVGMFIIYNTFSIVVAQRSKDMAMLRAIGSRRSQVLRSVLLEAVLIGVVAAALGLVAGVGLSFGLRELLGTVGLDIPRGSLVVDSRIIVQSFAVGVLTSVFSALVPAIRASRVRPIAALRDIAVDRSNASVGRAVVGLFITGAGVVAFGSGMAAAGTDSMGLIGLGAVVTILGVFTLGPVLVPMAMQVLGAPIAATGVTGAYARENARRSPKRTATTASALMIGVALVGFITIVAASTKASTAARVDRSFRSDFVIDSGSWDRGFATSIEADLTSVESIETVSPLRAGNAAVDGDTVGVNAVDTAVFDSLYDLDVSAGALADVTGDSVAVTSDEAEELGLAVGDSVPFRFPDGSSVDLTVKAIHDTDIPNSNGSWLLDLDTFAAHVPDQFDRMVYVSVDDSVSAAEARSALDTALEPWANASIEDRAEFKETVTADIDMMLNLIYGLLVLAVVISLLGIANTLALSVNERTRELGLLRAVGMHRTQLERAVRWEALMISSLGAVLGALLALGGAWGIVTAMESEGVTEMVVPGVRMAVIVGVAAIAGVLAATGPARRASKLDVLEALASE
jgi:putative ABC transport system permease protein